MILLFQVIGILQLVSWVNAACESGWTGQNGQCYKIILGWNDQTATWMDAWDICQDEKPEAYLMTFENVDDIKEIVKSDRDLWTQQALMYVGLTNFGSMEWVDGRSVGSELESLQPCSYYQAPPGPAGPCVSFVSLVTEDGDVCIAKRECNNRNNMIKKALCAYNALFETAPKCPIGWTMGPDAKTCFEFQEQGAKSSWVDQLCNGQELQDKSLAILDNIRDVMFVKRWVSSLSLSFSYNGARIGMTKLGSSNFRWTTGETAKPYMFPLPTGDNCTRLASPSGWNPSPLGITLRATKCTAYGTPPVVFMRRPGVLPLDPTIGRAVAAKHLLNPECMKLYNELAPTSTAPTTQTTTQNPTTSSSTSTTGTTTTPPSEMNLCQAGWTFCRGQCYKVNHLEETQNASWLDAYALCQGEKPESYLMVFENKAEISELIRQEHSFLPKTLIYVGLTNFGSMEWIDSNMGNFSSFKNCTGEEAPVGSMIPGPCASLVVTNSTNGDVCILMHLCDNVNLAKKRALCAYNASLFAFGNCFNGWKMGPDAFTCYDFKEPAGNKTWVNQMCYAREIRQQSLAIVQNVRAAMWLKHWLSSLSSEFKTTGAHIGATSLGSSTLRWTTGEGIGIYLEPLPETGNCTSLVLSSSHPLGLALKGSSCMVAQEQPVAYVERLGPLDIDLEIGVAIAEKDLNYCPCQLLYNELKKTSTLCSTKESTVTAKPTSTTQEVSTTTSTTPTPPTTSTTPTPTTTSTSTMPTSTTTSAMPTSTTSLTTPTSTATSTTLTSTTTSTSTMPTSTKTTTSTILTSATTSTMPTSTTTSTMPRSTTTSTSIMPTLTTTSTSIMPTSTTTSTSTMPTSTTTSTSTMPTSTTTSTSTIPTFTTTSTMPTSTTTSTMPTSTTTSTMPTSTTTSITPTSITTSTSTMPTSTTTSTMPTSTTTSTTPTSITTSTSTMPTSTTTSDMPTSTTTSTTPTPTASSTSEQTLTTVSMSPTSTAASTSQQISKRPSILPTSTTSSTKTPTAPKSTAASTLQKAATTAAPSASTGSSTPSKPASTSTRYPEKLSCSEWQSSGAATNGVYIIRPDAAPYPYNVYCDMESDGGGWAIIQRRVDDSVNFDQTWDQYKSGFGNDLSTFDNNFWLGNDKIHWMTFRQNISLKIDMWDCNGYHVSEDYSRFQTNSEADMYRLIVSDNPTGQAGNSMKGQNGMKFTTRDSDNDAWNKGNCAQFLTGGWWFSECGLANLNGVYHNDCYYMGQENGIQWYTWKDEEYSLRRNQMKIR